MAKWLAQLRALAGACEALARSIQSRIKLLPEPARNSATKAFVGALLNYVQEVPNLPQSVGLWMGCRCGDWPESIPEDLNGLRLFLSGLAKFISMEHNIGN